MPFKVGRVFSNHSGYPYKLFTCYWLIVLYAVEAISSVCFLDCFLLRHFLCDHDRPLEAIIEIQQNHPTLVTEEQHCWSRLLTTQKLLGLNRRSVLVCVIIKGKRLRKMALRHSPPVNFLFGYLLLIPVPFG